MPVRLLRLLAILAISAPAIADASGPDDPWPAEARELRRSVSGTRADIDLDLPARLFGPTGLPESLVEALHRHYLACVGEPSCDAPIAPLPTDVREVVLWTTHARRIAGVQARAGQRAVLPAWMAQVVPVPQKPYEKPIPVAAASGTLVGSGLPGPTAGGLSGKTVYLSPGHGFTWTQALDAWATQRGNTHNLVEDLLNAEAALHYLVPLLHNAGAQVVTMRERDMQTQMVVVDDAGAGYSETGPGWAKGSNPGYAYKAQHDGGENHMTMGSYRSVPATATGNAPTASASFLADVPEAGRYAVYLTWVAGQNRVTDAHVEIRHLGGSAHHRVDMTRHGGTWWYLGHYIFAKGKSADKGAVVLHNDTETGAKDKYLIADAVRLGGGMGSVVRGTGKPPKAGPTSGRPRWEESCRTYAQFAGAPASVYDGSSSDPSDDVGCRSRMAAWEHETGEDAIYLSWHTNAPSPARGTSTYVYGPNEPNGEYTFTGTKGSDAFGKLIQKIMVGDIKALWDPAWKDRGVYTAWFGELNPAHNNEMPAALVEAAFHSTLEDADQLRQPRFRHLLARSLYKAIAQYFADRDKVPLLLLPEPPESLHVRRTAPGKAKLTWKPGSSGTVFGQPATSYLVQLSSDGVAFDVGTQSAKPEFDVALPPGNQPLYLRVAATNPGGVSLPSAVVAASNGCDNGPRVLVVQGFTRTDAGMAPVDDLSAYNLAKVQRLRQWRMNTFAYAAQLAPALAATGLGIDMVAREAVDATVLGDHALVLWAAGENATVDGVLDANQQKLLADWLQKGKGHSLWLSGAEVAWALDKKGTPASGDWLQTWFGARFASDDAATYSVAAAAPLAGTFAFDDGSKHSYDVDFPDVLALQGATALLNYDGSVGVAASRFSVPGGAVSVLMGVPLETVYPEAARASLVAQLVAQTLGKIDCQGPAVVEQGDGPDAGSDAGSSAEAATSDAAAAGDSGHDELQSGDSSAGSNDAAVGGFDTASDAGTKTTPPPSKDDGCAAGSPASPWASVFGAFAVAWVIVRRRRARSA